MRLRHQLGEIIPFVYVFLGHIVAQIPTNCQEQISGKFIFREIETFLQNVTSNFSIRADPAS